MNDYYLRCIITDKPNLIALGVILGALQVDRDDSGSSVISAPGGCLDQIGTRANYLTGETLCDENGVPYWHANLRSPINLRDAAMVLAATHPEIAGGLADLGRFFVVDEAGAAVAPAFPQRVFL